MPTSVTIGWHDSNAPLSAGAMSYVCARNRHQTYNLLIREFKKSGWSQGQLATRTGIKREVISRLFKRPRNMEIDTLSKLLFGISGAALTLGPAWPRSESAPKVEIEFESIPLPPRTRRARTETEQAIELSVYDEAA